MQVKAQVIPLRSQAVRIRFDTESLFQQNLLRRERGQPQLHQCSVCGCCQEWGASWLWYGSLRDHDDGSISKFCSADCVAVGGKPRKAKK